MIAIAFSFVSRAARWLLGFPFNLWMAPVAPSRLMAAFARWTCRIDNHNCFAACAFVISLLRQAVRIASFSCSDKVSLAIHTWYAS